MFRSIIVGVDGRAGGDDAVALARALSGGGARLTLACSYLTDPVAARLVPGENASLRAAAVAYLEAARSDLADLDPEVVPVATSSPARGLHHLAETLDTDLIIVGSSHRGTIGRIVPGSVTQQVLHGSPCAVAIAPAGLAAGSPVELRRVGCAYDGEREARAALELAQGLVAEVSGTLEIIDVLALPSPFPGEHGAYLLPEPWEDVQKAVRAELDDALSSADRVSAEGLMPEGDPVEQLVGRSEVLDLLVMGSRGYGPLRRVLLGTVAGQVMREARCPVIIVPRGVRHDDEEPADTSTTPAAA